MLLLSFTAAFDSRDIAPAEWICGASLTATFSDGTLAACGAEVLQNVSSRMPTVSFAGAATAPAGTLYTLLVVDRDAPNASVPIRAPLLHMALASIPAAALSAGLGPALADGVVPLFAYSGPGPSAGSGCHRYYFQLYVQDATQAAPFLPANMSRFAWDFVSWATSSNLTKVPSATTHWRTQNLNARVEPCEAAPAAAAGGSSLALPVGLGLAAAAVAAAAAAIIAARRRRSSPAKAWDSGVVSGENLLGSVKGTL
jgi:phosphatidylethanolamine-binding protein (PEBP) family uncharacterized protein